MDRSAKIGTWIIATGVILAFLYAGREILSTFAMAVFLFLIIEGFATAVDNATTRLNQRQARVIAILIITGGFIGFIALMANGVAEFGRDAGDYETRINALISDAYGVVGMHDSPTTTTTATSAPCPHLVATTTGLKAATPLTLPATAMPLRHKSTRDNQRRLQPSLE